MKLTLKKCKSKENLNKQKMKQPNSEKKNYIKLREEVKRRNNNIILMQQNNNQNSILNEVTV